VFIFSALSYRASSCDISGLTLQAKTVKSRKMEDSVQAIPPLEIRTRFMTPSSFALGTGLVNVRCDYPSVRQITIMIKIIIQPNQIDETAP
jgi:hypothetical protein